MSVEKIETEIDLSGKVGRSTPVEVEQDDSIQVIERNDTPEQDRGRKPRDPNAKTAIPEDEEIGQYTKGVQDRMKQMKWEYHEERRAKEAWQREHGAAVDFAKKVHAENKRLRELVQSGHKTMLEGNKVAAETEMATLQEALKTALDTGDTTKAAELQTRLSKAAARAEAVQHIAPIRFEEEQADAAPSQQQVQPQVRLTSKMQEWMDENPWFNTNKRMTAFAFGVHEELIDKGIPPESPKYFSEINKAVRGAFAEYFDAGDDDGDERDERQDRQDRQPDRDQRDRRGNPPPQRRTNVAAPTRSAAVRNPTKVELTSSEMAVARRLGITPEQYAREKIRLENT